MVAVSGVLSTAPSLTVKVIVRVADGSLLLPVGDRLQRRLILGERYGR
jgi:hypothetical protein